MQERRNGIYICQVTNCTMPTHTNGYCRSHYWKSYRPEGLAQRIEITTNEREWYAEQGRTLDEAALLSRRIPMSS